MALKKMPKKNLMLLGVAGAVFILIAVAAFGGSSRSTDSDLEGVPGMEEGELNETGTPVSLTEGNTGSISIPLVGIQVLDTDEKHHWDMPPETVKVKATLTWEDTSWELDFAIGTGECPHSGTTLASAADSSGSITLEYEADGEALEEGQWFAHVAAPDADSHRGESVSYSIDVELFPAEGGEEAGGE